jgi:transposase
MLNQFFHRSRMSPNEFIDLVGLFCRDKTATDVARLLRRQRKTVNTIFNRIRLRIAEVLEKESPFSQVADRGRSRGSYNGVEFIRGIEQAAALKPMMIGIFRPACFYWTHSRREMTPVFTEVLPEINLENLNSLLKGDYRLTTVFTYDRLLGGSGYYPENKIDKYTDPFYTFFGSRMISYYGVPPQTRYLHLKENEWKFNNPNAVWRQYRLLNLIIDNPL